MSFYQLYELIVVQMARCGDNDIPWSKAMSVCIENGIALKTFHRFLGAEDRFDPAQRRDGAAARRRVDRDLALARDHLDEVRVAPAHPGIGDPDQRDAVRLGLGSVRSL